MLVNQAETRPASALHDSILRRRRGYAGTAGQRRTRSNRDVHDVERLLPWLFEARDVMRRNQRPVPLEGVSPMRQSMLDSSSTGRWSGSIRPGPSTIVTRPCEPANAAARRASSRLGAETESHFRPVSGRCRCRPVPRAIRQPKWRGPFMHPPSPRTSVLGHRQNRNPHFLRVPRGFDDTTQHKPPRRTTATFAGRNLLPVTHPQLDKRLQRQFRVFRRVVLACVAP